MRRTHIMSHLRVFLAVLLMVLAVPLSAESVQPNEILADPELEARAREISKELRCLVCQNESIDDSNAELARDLRLLVRERLTAGDNDQEVKDYLVARYGEFVLLKPVFSISNAALWLAGPFLFLLGLLIAFLYLRSRRSGAQVAAQPLTLEEHTALNELIEK